MELKDINIGAELIHDAYGICKITGIDSDGEIFFTEIKASLLSSTIPYNMILLMLFFKIIT